jgi:hypothetical protein
MNLKSTLNKMMHIQVFKKFSFLIICLALGNLFVTESKAQSKPEVEINASSLEEVKSKYIEKVLSNGSGQWSLKEETSSTVTLTRPCGTGFSCSFTQLMIGNSRSTLLQIDLSASFFKTSNGVKIVVSKLEAWTQMPGGQINRTNMMGADDTKVLQKELDSFASSNQFAISPPPPQLQLQPEPSSSETSLSKKLKDLIQLRDEKLISEEEYNRLRAKVLGLDQ